MLTHQDLHAFFHPEFQKYPKIHGVRWEWRKEWQDPNKRKWKVEFKKNKKNYYAGKYTDFYEAVYSLWIARNFVDRYETLNYQEYLDSLRTVK